VGHPEDSKDFKDLKDSLDSKDFQYNAHVTDVRAQVVDESEDDSWEWDFEDVLAE
jgi:hypothetical protein